MGGARSTMLQAPPLVSRRPRAPRALRRSLRSLDRGQQLAEDRLELLDLLRREPLEELALRGDIRRDRRVDDLGPLIRELDEDASPIVGVVPATDEALSLQPVDAARDPGGGQHQPPG